MVSGCFPQPVCKVNLIRGPFCKPLVRSVLIKSMEVSGQTLSKLSNRVVRVQVDMFILPERQSLSMNTLSIQRPLPSILIWIPLAFAQDPRADIDARYSILSGLWRSIIAWRSESRLAERPFQKIALQGELSDLGV